MILRTPRSPLFPYTTLFRSLRRLRGGLEWGQPYEQSSWGGPTRMRGRRRVSEPKRLNSSVPMPSSRDVSVRHHIGIHPAARHCGLADAVAVVAGDDDRIALGVDARDHADID